MKEQKPWVEALNVSASDLSKWMSEVPSPDFITFWSLDRGKIDLRNYFSWAKNHYGLAFLKPDFFEQPPNVNLWKQIESVANWSPQMVPVKQWDGVVFVACVEPQSDINWSFPVQYVLAEPQSLKAYWEKLNSEPEVVPATPKPTPAPVVPEPIPNPEPSAETRPEDLLQDTPAPEEQEEIHEEAEAPEGIQLSVDESVEEVPAGLSADTPAPSVPVLQLDNLLPAQDDSGPQPPPEAKEPANFSAPEAQAEPEPKKPSVPPPPANYDTGTKATEVTRVASVLDHLQKDFEGSILLLQEGNELKPIVWDKKWKPQDGAKGPESLDEASAFRVVVRTKHPYLGHVVDTPVNRNFFSAWGMQEFPEKILVQPVMDGSSLLGVFVSICNPSVKNQVLLSAGVRHSKEVARMLTEDQVAAA